MKATKTLEAIEEALYKDQGAKFRGFLKEVMPLAGDAYSTKQDDWRDHLGASVIGRKCGRELWYSFHWTTLKRFDGRMLRLFNRGHLEEPRFIALLMMIGCQVWQVDENGKQFKISGHMKHFGGSMDAVALGIPDNPAEPMLVEFKTHGEKSFITLQASGLLTAKWEHFIQMQIYMGKNNLKQGLYLAVNKNTDEIHGEIIQFDQTQYERHLNRSVDVITSVTPLPKISQSPGWYECKFCDHRGVCHGKDLPAVNCRTCLYSRPIDEGKWSCMHTDRPEQTLTPALQRTGCELYESNPAFKGK